MTCGQQRDRSHKTRRLGVTSIGVLVCLLLGVAVLVAMLQTIGRQKAGADAELRRQQAAWLVEAGLERAAASLADDPDYAGETWTLPAGALHKRDAAIVEITVTGDGDKRQVEVHAQWPREGLRRARHSKQLTMRLSMLRNEPRNFPARTNPATVSRWWSCWS